MLLNVERIPNKDREKDRERRERKNKERRRDSLLFSSEVLSPPGSIISLVPLTFSRVSPICHNRGLL